MNTESTRTEEMPQNEGRLVPERSGPAGQTGTSGVSDTRRAQLARMEADAGTAHEAADESVPQVHEPDKVGTGLKPDLASGPPNPASPNSSMDKR